MPDHEIECAVDFNLNDDSQSISALIHRMAGILGDLESPWHLDLSKCHYFGPDTVAIVISAVLESRRRGQVSRVTLPVGPPPLAAFCEFSGLRHFLNGSALPNAENPENNTLAARVITKARTNDADPIALLVGSYVTMTDETAEYLRMCVNEVIQNVEDHSKSAIGAILSARYLQNRGEVRVAIVDRGVGIATTLKERFPRLADSKLALQRVILGGSSAKSKSNNMGQGISNLFAIVAKNFKGNIFILSEDAYIGADSGIINLLAKPLKTRFPGTGAFFTIPVT